MLNADILDSFVSFNFQGRAPKTLDDAVHDVDILNFINLNNLNMEALNGEDAEGIYCALGLIKTAVVKHAHDPRAENAVNVVAGTLQPGHEPPIKRAYDAWLGSQSLSELYDAGEILIAGVRASGLKINALFFYDYVVFKIAKFKCVGHGMSDFTWFFIISQMSGLKHSDGMKGPTAGEIKNIRDEAGLTQKQAAELLYVDIRTWQKWEYGERAMSPANFELFLIKALSPRARARLRLSQMELSRNS